MTVNAGNVARGRAALSALSVTVLASLAALPATAAGAAPTRSTQAARWAARPALKVQVISRSRNPLYRTTAASESSADQPPAGTLTISYDVPTPEADIYMQVVHPTDANGNIIPAPVILSDSPYSGGALYNDDAGHWVNELG